MIHIYATYGKTNSFENVAISYIRYLPLKLVKKMNAFRFKQDSYRFLLGKLLLVKGIERLGYTDLTLEHLCVDRFSKPYFAPANSPIFNISHAGDYVICAMSETHRVGIDLEKVEYIDQEDFIRCFTKEEWACIRNSTFPLREFYRFWTRKEAIIKADGRGLHIPLLDFEVVNDCVAIEPDYWHIHELTIADDYVAHLATDANVRGECVVQHIIF